MVTELHLPKYVLVHPHEAIEMVQREGLDIEIGVDFVESDEGSILPDPGEAEFLRDDELESESGDDDGDAAPREHSDEEEMQATEEDSEHEEEEKFADDEEPDFMFDWGRDLRNFGCHLHWNARYAPA